MPIPRFHTDSVILACIFLAVSFLFLLFCLFGDDESADDAEDILETFKDEE